MAQQLLDRYIAGSSTIHTLDARVKLVLTIALILCAALLPAGAWLALSALTALVWAAIVASGVGLRRMLRRSLLALPFLLVVITLIFTVPGRPVLRLPLGFVTLTATDAGLLRFLTIVWKSGISMQAALLLTATTHFLDVLRAIQALHMPKIIVALLSFMYRYLFILIDEAQRLLRARDCRSAALDGSGGGSLLWRAQVTGRLVGTLFLRSFERSERIYIAMLSRGYTGELRTLSASALSWRDLRIGLGVGAILLIITAQAFVG
jgi:cobalt/nickel transport system permease protein